jgi:hypothetical protein
MENTGPLCGREILDRISENDKRPVQGEDFRDADCNDIRGMVVQRTDRCHGGWKYASLWGIYSLFNPHFNGDLVLCLVDAVRHASSASRMEPT